LILDRMHFRMFVRSYNLEPFNSILPYLQNRDSYNFNTWAMNLFGNMIMLVPLSILAPLLFPSLRKTVPFIICLLTVNLGIEVIQYYTRLGIFDIDDIILNSSGAIIAYAGLRIILSFINNITRT